MVDLCLILLLKDFPNTSQAFLSACFGALILLHQQEGVYFMELFLECRTQLPVSAIVSASLNGT